MSPRFHDVHRALVGSADLQGLRLGLPCHLHGTGRESAQAGCGWGEIDAELDCYPAFEIRSMLQAKGVRPII